MFVHRVQRHGEIIIIIIIADKNIEIQHDRINHGVFQLNISIFLIGKFILRAIIYLRDIRQRL